MDKPAEWQFPQIGPGTHVVHYGDTTKSDKCFGIVLTPKSRSATILIFPEYGQPEIREDCWAVDDPWQHEKPQAFLDVLEPTRGLFELAPSEVWVRDLRVRMLALEQTLEKLLLAQRKKD